MDAPAISLASAGIQPGDVVKFRAVGSWSPGSQFPEVSFAAAVFSSSSTLLPYTEAHRVPGAIACGQTVQTDPTFFTNSPTDIPEDFGFGPQGQETSVTVPPGANFVFIAVPDRVYGDNSDPNGDFAVEITLVSRPGGAQGQETWKFDPTFQRTPLRVTSEAASGVKVLRSGKVLIHTINGGRLSGANGQRIGALIRIDPNTGAIDPTWQPDAAVTGSGFLGIAEAPDGKIYYSTELAGEVVTAGADPATVRLIRLNTDGSRDTSFNSPIFGVRARFVTVQPDGKIIVCAGGINLFGVPQPGSIVQTVRLNTDGSLDTGFQSPNFQSNATDPAPTVANYRDSGLFGNPVVDPATGKIYFCGFFRFVNGQPRKAIVRCNPDGTLDTSFVPTGLTGGTAILTARAIVPQAGGKVVIGGNNLRTAAGGSTRYALLRFNDDGSLDPGFTLFPTTTSAGAQLFPGYFGPRHIQALPDGKILSSDVRVIRFLPDGAVDSAVPILNYTSPYFTNQGQVAAFRFDINPNNGVAYLENPGSLYTRLGGATVGNITKLNPDGAIDPQFSAPIVESEDFAPDVQIARDGQVYVSGFHTAFGSAPNATVARLRADGTRDPSFSLDVLPFPDKQSAGFSLLPDGASYVVYASGAFNGGYQFSNLVRLLPTGALDTSFRPSSALQTAFSINAFDGNDVAKSSLGKISAAPTGQAYLFPGGSQATVNANGNLKLTRVNSDGTEDSSVPPLGFPVGEITRDPSSQQITGGSSGYLIRLGETADGGLLVLASVAPFPTTTGAPYNYQLIKFRADGRRDANFASPSLTSTGPAQLGFPSLFDPVTGSTAQPINGFYSAGESPVSSAATFPDGSILLVGNFRFTGSSTDYSLAKLTSTGAFDTSFNPPVPGPQNSARPNRPALLTNARVAPDGKIWVLGRFDTFGGSPAPGVARLNSNGTFDTTFALADVGFYDSFDDRTDIVFADRNTAYLVGTYRRQGESMPFAITRIVGPPAITSPLTATATVNRQFIYQFQTEGATSRAVSNLPPGLSYDDTIAAIVGIPTTAGTFQINLRAANSTATTDAVLTLTVQPAPAGPAIASSTAATGRTGQPFSFQVFTSGATGAAAPRPRPICRLASALMPSLASSPAHPPWTEALASTLPSPTAPRSPPPRSN